MYPNYNAKYGVRRPRRVSRRTKHRNKVIERSREYEGHKILCLSPDGRLEHTLKIIMAEYENQIFKVVRILKRTCADG